MTEHYGTEFMAVIGFKLRMFRRIKENTMTNIQLIDGKRYVVLECEFAREWRVGRASSETVTYSEAEEIANHYRKYLKIPPERILIVEVPNVIKSRD